VKKDPLEEKCKHSSDMEKLATEAERASVKYKQIEFMLDKVKISTSVRQGVIHLCSYQGRQYILREIPGGVS